MNDHPKVHEPPPDLAEILPGTLNFRVLSLSQLRLELLLRQAMSPGMRNFLTALTAVAATASSIGLIVVSWNEPNWLDVLCPLGFIAFFSSVIIFAVRSNNVTRRLICEPGRLTLIENSRGLDRAVVLELDAATSTTLRTSHDADDGEYVRLIVKSGAGQSLTIEESASYSEFAWLAQQIDRFSIAALRNAYLRKISKQKDGQANT